ncbi:MAG: hypothetical protein DSY55_03755 [Clostridia bacterium]|nr:MAG: hypothetical protein DSY55_03755 [Clostridia bacterium]
MSDYQFNLIDDLTKFNIFRDLSPEALRTVHAYTTSRPLPPGYPLFHQGDVVPRLFLIVRGEVELVREDTAKRDMRRVLGPGEILGRMILDSGAKQLGTATTLTEVELIVVSVESLISLASLFPDWRNRFDRQEVIGLIRANPYFSPLNETEIKWISDWTQIGRARKNELLAKENDLAADVTIIRQGRVRLTSQSLHRHRWISAGSVIGNQALLTGTRRKYSAIVESETLFVKLPKAGYWAIVDRYPDHKWIHDAIDVEVFLSRAPLFRLLTEEKIKRLAGYTMRIHFHQSGRTVSDVGKPDNYYHILVAGKAQQRAVNELGAPLAPEIVSSGFCFGERSLLQGAPAEIRVETITPTNWLQIHRLDFEAFKQDNPDAKLNQHDELKSQIQQSTWKSAWQRPGEAILFRKRRHIIVLLHKLLGALVLFALYLAFLFLLSKAYISIAPVIELVPILFIFLPIFGWITADYLNDYFIVTTSRIMHEEKVPVVYERRKSAPIDKIQNYRVERNLFAKVLGYGHLVISTAAEVGQIKFDYLSHPDIVLDAISDASKRMKSIAVAEEPEERILRRLRASLSAGFKEALDERALVQSPPSEMVSASTKRNWHSRLLLFLGRLGGYKKMQSDNRLVWRKHWFGLLLSSVFPFSITIGLLMLLSLFLSRFLSQTTPSPFEKVWILLLLLFLVLSFGWLWWRWTDWMNDYYIVTDQYIERISQKPLWFDEDRMKINLDRVENVEYRLPGFIAKTLHFGNVIIQTAATQGEIDFNYVPNPASVHADIFERIEAKKERAMTERSKQRDQDFVKWLAAYHKLMASRGEHRMESE